MTHSADTPPIETQRAQMGLSRTLRDLDGLGQRLTGCNNPQLCAALEYIKKRKAGQSARFLRLLQQRGIRFESAFANVRRTRSFDDPGRAAILIERREITPDLVVLKVRRPANVNFLPGQSIKLGLGGVKRRYSIVSAPQESSLEFFVELVSGGRMSERLRRLQVGDALTLESPEGEFVLDGHFSHHLMIATVTGVSPFVSMLRHYFRTRDTHTRDDTSHGQLGQHRFHLLHGASHKDEFGYRDELEQIAAAHPASLIYTPTVSRPEDARNLGWSGEHGRVETLVEEVLKRFGLTASSTLLYACGNPGMVDDVEQRYRRRGFSVKTERYD